MCDSSQQTTSKPRSTESGSRSVTESDSAKPKVCNCDKPCCRSKLIKQATATAGQAPS